MSVQSSLVFPWASKVFTFLPYFHRTRANVNLWVGCKLHLRPRRIYPIFWNRKYFSSKINTVLLQFIRNAILFHKMLNSIKSNYISLKKKSISAVFISGKLVSSKAHEHIGRNTWKWLLKRKVAWGSSSKTLKNGSKWEWMNKLMIKEDFFFLFILEALSSLASQVRVIFHCQHMPQDWFN